MQQQTFLFDVSAQELINLIKNNFYSNKEFFLKELISNASDALDKIRYKSITGYPIHNEPNFLIRICPNKINNTLTIIDTGIGMTKQELIFNLGTIIRGCRKMAIEILQTRAETSMMNQFGIGFHSVFLVADKVTVISKSDDEDKQYKWESTGEGTFTVAEDESNHDQLTRGTKIILHLKNDHLEFLEENKIKEIFHKRFEFISFLVELQIEKEVLNDNEDKSEKREIIYEWVKLNKPKPIWMRKPEDVTKEEYAAFYKSLSNELEDPLAVKHFSVDGQLEFNTIVFIPQKAPFDLSESKKSNIHLYVRRVFIMNDCEELVPEYLNFITGVVDSEDLPLNISKEFLKQNKILRVLKKHIVKKALELIQEISENKEEYNKFYEQFSKNIKLGLQQDTVNKTKLIELLRFYTSKSGDEQISLKQYVEGMKEGQKDIFFITGESKTAVANSPLIEPLKKKGYEVIFLVDPNDEFVIPLQEYEGKKFRDWTKERVKLKIWEEERKKIEEEQAGYEGLCMLIKEVLGDKVQKVRVGTRISDSPCMLAADEFDWSANMGSLMEGRVLRESIMMSKKSMEINPDHDMIIELKKKKDADIFDKSVTDLIWKLFETVC